MGQITAATIKLIRDHVSRGQKPPLTLWEFEQLAWAWERWQDAIAASGEPHLAAQIPVNVSDKASCGSSVSDNPVDQAMDEAVAAGDGTLHGAIDYWQERALKAEAALGEQEKATEGAWKLVPVEPTEEMHAAAVRTVVRCAGNDDFPPRVWRAMLAAAPSSQAAKP